MPPPAPSVARPCERIPGPRACVPSSTRSSRRSPHRSVPNRPSPHSAVHPNRCAPQRYSRSKSQHACHGRTLRPSPLHRASPTRASALPRPALVAPVDRLTLPPSASRLHWLAPVHRHTPGRYPPPTPPAATAKSSTVPLPHSPRRQTAPPANHAPAHPPPLATRLVRSTLPPQPPAGCVSPVKAAPATARLPHTSGQTP